MAFSLVQVLEQVPAASVELRKETVGLFAKEVVQAMKDKKVITTGGHTVSESIANVLALASADILIPTTDWVATWEDCLSKHCSASKILNLLVERIGITVDSLKSLSLPSRSSESKGYVWCEIGML